MLTRIVTDVLDYPGMYILAVFLALAAGGGVALWLKRRAGNPRLSRLRLGEPRLVTIGEYITGAVIIVTIITPGMNTVSTEVAKSNAVGGYHELWGGSVLDVGSKKVPCQEDGFCTPSYHCHPYWVQVKVHDGWKTVDDGYDAQTKTRKTHQEEIYHYEDQQRWHQCPYVKYVMDYWVETTFGRREVATHVLPPTLEPFEGRPILSSIRPHGPPAYWTRAEEAKENHRPLPAKKDNTYVNYLLAAQAACPRDYSDKFQTYKSRGLLVDHTENYTDPINDEFTANEMVFAKQAPPNKAEFEAALSMHNAELGMQKQGDMHVVVVPDSEVNLGHADEYAGTLCSWWQHPDRGKNGLAKNTIMVILGVSNDFSAIKWSRAFTGIPLGNGGMLTALSNDLAGKVPFTPLALFGDPTATVNGDEITYYHSDGAIEKIVLDEYPFNRPCMITCDPGQQGGFQYVSAAIMLTNWDKVWLQTLTLVVCLLLWLLFAMVAFRKELFVRGYQYIRYRKWRAY